MVIKIERTDSRSWALDVCLAVKDCPFSVPLVSCIPPFAPVIEAARVVNASRWTLIEAGFPRIARKMALACLCGLITAQVGRTKAKARRKLDTKNPSGEGRADRYRVDYATCSIYPLLKANRQQQEYNRQNPKREEKESGKKEK
jgi:hypothetical protein